MVSGLRVLARFLARYSTRHPYLLHSRLVILLVPLDDAKE